MCSKVSQEGSGGFSASVLAERVYEVVREAYLKCVAEGRDDGWFAGYVEAILRGMGLEDVEISAAEIFDGYRIHFKHDGRKYIAFVDVTAEDFELCEILIEKPL
ncbi:MAG: hypothetical protein B6U76_00940 [Desulfurococcales archaeon ex4484_217_2]|nr:MAG: hypothetical protein B6U76_00940 [Desulfurococcales archaeon ex4484_217_2]